MIPLSIISFGIFSMVVGISRSIVLTAAAIALAGLLWTWILSTLISTYQMLTPDWVRGRTMGAFVLSVFGFVPLGSVVAGALGSSLGADSALIVFSAGVIAVGLSALRMPLPVLEQIQPPVVPQRTFRRQGDEPKNEAVMITNTWTIDEEEFDDFVELLARLRKLRLRTGAYQWTAYRSATNLSRISETFMLHSWEQHLQQHRRLDVQDLATIAEMRKFSRPETLVQDHLVAFDVDHPDRRPAWHDLVAVHEEFHVPHLDDERT